ncbi:hypothetical protein GCM10011506_36520 [Marivirga lumbricoides]|uniref:Uncharacterized protein n=1 Tax=Marivirga lumbricoides TaxID=1046115 RepID=A0ABQ1N2G2_9BACT|nr:hypothetical protein GCM10011506_36520 [Marivirga lumbricoides]
MYNFIYREDFTYSWNIKLEDKYEASLHPLPFLKGDTEGFLVGLAIVNQSPRPPLKERGIDHMYNFIYRENFTYS